MELYQIRYFIALAETGSFTRAAERCFVTQPTLSTGIRKLEESLQTRLIERTKRRALPTAAGRLFLERARVIAEECARAGNELRAAATTPRLRLGILRSLPGTALARLVGDFSRQHPDIRVDLIDGRPDELDAELKNGRLHMALTSTLSDAAASGDTRLFRDRYLLFVADTHPLAGKALPRLADLEGERLILRARCERIDDTTEAFRVQNVRPRIIHRSDQDDWTLALVAAGAGLAILPELFRADGVARLPISDLPFAREVVLRTSEASRGNPTAALLARFITSHDWLATKRDESGAHRLKWAR